MQAKGIAHFDFLQLGLRKFPHLADVVHIANQDDISHVWVNPVSITFSLSDHQHHSRNYRCPF